MVEFFYLLLCLVQVLVGFYMLFPVVLLLLSIKKNPPIEKDNTESDYAIIVTAYEQVALIPSVLSSILKLNYKNYLVYVVADKCDPSILNITDERVSILYPETVLANNIKSHFYAISKFKRNHERLTIIDSDNLVHPDYLTELDIFFNKGFLAVQGVRIAKNLNTQYACLDEAGDIYYRYVDRKILYEAGSSASLAGSGMAFSTKLYIECLKDIEIYGAGFDKLLQFEIIKRGYRIAFSQKAVVLDEKTAKSDQLVKQRARWINSWFKYSLLGVKLGKIGVRNMDWNQLLFAVMLLRPPLFIILVFYGFCFLGSLLLQPLLLSAIWLSFFILFLTVFYLGLKYFKASPLIYKSLISYPLFFYFQILALLKSKNANELSVATKHEQT